MPVPGCVVLCLTQMDAILDVDPRNLMLRAQPGAITQHIDDAEGLQLAAARRNAFAALARRRPTTILEDVTVPRSELAALVTFIAETAAAHDLQIGTFGHMGDGNLHPTFLTDERNQDEMHRVHRALEAIVKKTLELGGTITGEHGVGLAKKPWLRGQMGDASFELMRQVKRAIDPNGLLNPGKIFDAEDNAVSTGHGVHGQH